MAFYMVAALVVGDVLGLSLTSRWLWCMSALSLTRPITNEPRNKAVLNDVPNLPMLFMMLQSITTVLLLQLSSVFTDKVQIPTIELQTAQKLAPLLCVDVAGFIFNALCLRDVEAAFFQVGLHHSSLTQIARGLVLPLTIIASSVSARQRPAAMVVLAATIVTAGFFIGIAPSGDIPERSIPRPLGLFYGFISSCTIAIHAVLIKTSLPIVHGSVTQLSYWGNLVSAGSLLGIILMNGELESFSSLVKSGSWDWRVFLWGNVITGIFGFLISIAGILSVKVTSPVTHMFSSVSPPSTSLTPDRTKRSTDPPRCQIVPRHSHLVGLHPVKADPRNRVVSMSVIMSGTL